MTCYDILGIASTNTQKGYMWSFLRLILILAPILNAFLPFLSLKTKFVNPMLSGLENKINFMWPEATLAPFLEDTLAPFLDKIWRIVTLGFRSSINDIDIPWVNDHIKWLAQANALVILGLGIGFLVVSILLYLSSLLVRMLHQCCKVDGDAPDINYASYAKRLAECSTEDVPELIKKIKQEERDMTRVKHPTQHRPIFSSLNNFPYAASLFFPRLGGVSFCMVQVEEPHHLQVERIGKCSCLSCTICRLACCSCVN